MSKLLQFIQSRTSGFLFGDIFTMGIFLIVDESFTHSMLKALTTGIIGGLAGMGSKDLYPVVKKWIKKKLKKPKRIQHEKFPKKNQ